MKACQFVAISSSNITRLISISKTYLNFVERNLAHLQSEKISESFEMYIYLLFERLSLHSEYHSLKKSWAMCSTVTFFRCTSSMLRGKSRHDDKAMSKKMSF